MSSQGYKDASIGISSPLEFSADHCMSTSDLRSSQEPNGASHLQINALGCGLLKCTAPPVSISGRVSPPTDSSKHKKSLKQGFRIGKEFASVNGKGKAGKWKGVDEKGQELEDRREMA